MKNYIYLLEDEIACSQRKLRGYKLLEICQDNELRDKLAYWNHICFPKPEIDLPYKYINRKTGNILYSVYPNVNNVKNKNDYEPITEV